MFSFFGVGILDFFLLRKTIGPKIPKFIKPAYFLLKYIGTPLVAYKLMDNYVDLEGSFLEAAEHYNFGFEQFEGAMAIFEKAKLLG